MRLTLKSKTTGNTIRVGWKPAAPILSMISSKHRFHGRGSLSVVYRNGTTTRGPLFAVKSTVNKNRDTYRLAVVISRKVNKSAVARNRMRRRLYSAIKNVEDGIIKPYDIVVTVYQSALLQEPSESLNRQVEHQLNQAGILARPPEA